MPKSIRRRLEIDVKGAIALLYLSVPLLSRILPINTRKRNAWLNLYETEHSVVNMKSLPTTYVLGITNKCNLQCPLCITGMYAQKKAIKHMEIELFYELLEKIKDHAVVVQLYNWGESLFHPKFLEMLKATKQHGIAVQISTNFSLKLSDDFLGNLIDGGLDDLVVSLDGMTRETYLKYRIGGDFDLVVSNMKRVQELKRLKGKSNPRITWQFLRNKYNEHEIPALESRHKEFGADCYTVPQTILQFMNNDHQYARDWISDEEIERRQYLDVDSEFHGKKCMFLHNVMVIEHDASVAPCCYSTNPADDFARFDKTQSISQLYNSRKFQDSRRLFRGEQVSGSFCEGCSVFLTYRQKQSWKTPE
jgi:MoaA/NifB/PqqE/SkfB family radical SAM enzyme